MQGSGPPPLSPAESLPDRCVAGGGREQAIEQRPQIQARAPDDYRQSNRADAGEQRPSPASELTGREYLARVGDVEHVMGNSPPLLGPKLGGSDIEMTIYLQGIAADHFPAECLAQAQREFAFP
jgi:hypothetical protein